MGKYKYLLEQHLVKTIPSKLVVLRLPTGLYGECNGNSGITTLMAIAASYT